MSILNQIVIQRKKDVADAKSKVSLEQLKETISKNESEGKFKANDFHGRLLGNFRAGKVSVIAEVKRASPSKGDIAPGIDASQQGAEYAQAGATAISCLTEPTWFKGTLDDLTGIRIKIDSMGESRPSILRKDFLIDEYQMYEARAAGADTVLIIVAAMERDDIKGQLSHLISVSRQLGMEPLVEVNNQEETKIAVEVGAKIIGVNNRNLHDFQVDLSTTTRLVAGLTLPADSLMVALSGISNRRDVEYFEKSGVKCVLVGESLMRAADPKNKIEELTGTRGETLVKICGLRDVATALHTANAGADFIGLVFAESKRKVSVDEAKSIVEAIHKHRGHGKVDLQPSSGDLQSWTVNLRKAVSQARPLVVGVFADNSPEYIKEILEQVPLDIVQLSGHENYSVVDELPTTSWKAVHVGPESDADGILAGITSKKMLSAVLLDTQDPSAPSVRGGTGKTFDWTVAQKLGEKVPLFVAGGLSTTNVFSAVKQTHPFGVDVSTGVETDGKKDLKKITEFVQQAKQ